MDFEAVSLAIYAEAAMDPAEPLGPFALAEALGVAVCYDERELLPGSPAAYCPVRDVIWLRPGQPVHAEGLRVFHELAERALLGVPLPCHEDACDQLAFRLRMPRPCFAWLAEMTGPRWTALARPWRASHVAAGLRWGEVVRDPTAVVTDEAVRTRGEHWAWPVDLRTRVERGDLPGAVVDRVRGGFVVRAT